MNQEITRTGDKMWLKILLLTLLATAGVFAWSSAHYKADDRQRDTWVDVHGHLHVLGITLGETTLRQAENILQSRSDIALYIYPREHPSAGMTLEAFFPSIADHSKVILLLDTGIDMLHAIEVRASQPHLYPNTVARMNLHPEDVKLAHKLPVRELTLIPSVEVGREGIEARFGKPEGEQQLPDGSFRLLYPGLGLSVELQEDDATRLHFSNPEQYRMP